MNYLMAIISKVLGDVIWKGLREIFTKTVEVSDSGGVLDNTPTKPGWLQDTGSVRGFEEDLAGRDDVH